jgi:hypothetical protein
MEVRKNDTVLECAICGRTLLLGERIESYRAGPRQVGVCQLCVTEAEQRGWLRQGAPEPPPVFEPAVERGESRLSRILGGSRGDREPTAAVADVRDAAPDDVGLATARDGIAAFNQSPYRRTVSGISKSLGEPRVSVVALSGARPDVVVTVAWDISWYQYRVDVSASGVRLESRGDDVEELDARWCAWNAEVGRDGRLALAG